MGIVAGVVAELQSAGIANLCAHRRWLDPTPGNSVVVVTSESTWTAGRTSAEYPLVKVLIYSAPTVDQDDAEQVGEPVATAVRQRLHLLDGHVHYWGNSRVIDAKCVGASLAEPEGHPDWRLRTLVLEVQTV